MSLQRLILSLDKDGIQLRALYRRRGGSSPGTKARTQDAFTLVAGQRARVEEPIHAPEQGGDE